MSKTAQKCQFRKVLKGAGHLSSYEVLRAGIRVGFVWSQKELSYRGMDGWNSGVRIKDFHPTRWQCGKTLGEYTRGLSYESRERATEPLLNGGGVP